MVDGPIDVDRAALAACTPDEREHLVDALLRQAAALHTAALRVVAEADHQRDFEADGAHSMADWLGHRFQLAPCTARRMVRAAHLLAEMPALESRCATGTVSFEALSQVLPFAEPADDEVLSGLLPALGFTQVEAMAKGRRQVRAAERDDARRRTQLRLVPDRSGLGSRVTGFLPTEDAAYVATALERRAEAAGPDPETGTWSPHATRLAGALRDLCAEDLADTAVRASNPDRTLVVVHVPADAVTDPAGSARAATIDGNPLDADALQRLLCDTKVEFSVDGPDGTTVGIGRTSRNPPPWLRRRVLARDGGCCRWPGCNRPIRHLHHLEHWTRGGETSSSNLLGVCWHHHHLLHEGGWGATGNADGEVALTSPDRRVVRSRAGPLAA